VPTQHPSPRFLTQAFLTVTVEKAADSTNHYVHIRKTAQVPYGSHPQFTPNEAEALARDVNNAAADARRKNIAGNI